MGESKTVAYAAGLRPSWMQYQALFVGGMLAGMGGAQLSLAYTGVWTEGITAGRGFIAVALVIFAAWNPLRAVLGALIFGGALAFQLQLQARGAPVSPFFLDMIPYLLTLGVLLFLRGNRRYSHACRAADASSRACGRDRFTTNSIESATKLTKRKLNMNDENGIVLRRRAALSGPVQLSVLLLAGLRCPGRTGGAGRSHAQRKARRLRGEKVISARCTWARSPTPATTRRSTRG